MKFWIMVLIIITATAEAANPTQNKVYALCIASLSYMADEEAKSGKCPNYRRLNSAALTYFGWLDSVYRQYAEDSLKNMYLGSLDISDIRGTAENCLRWEENDEIGDIQ